MENQKIALKNFTEEELKELVNNRDKNQEKYNKKNDDKIKKDKETI